MGSNFVGTGAIGEVTRKDRKARKIYSVSQPEAVNIYNKGMLGVDLFDQKMSYHKAEIKSAKWTMKASSYYFDMASVVAHCEYKNVLLEQGDDPSCSSSLYDFKLSIALSLIKGPPKRRGRPRLEEENQPPAKLKKSASERPPPTAIRTDNFEHFADFDIKKNKTRCKLVNCRFKTNVFCLKCQVHYCFTSGRNCFREAHQQ